MGRPGAAHPAPGAADGHADRRHRPRRHRRDQGSAGRTQGRPRDRRHHPLDAAGPPHRRPHRRLRPRPAAPGRADRAGHRHAPPAPARPSSPARPAEPPAPEHTSASGRPPRTAPEKPPGASPPKPPPPPPAPPIRTPSTPTAPPSHRPDDHRIIPAPPQRLHVSCCPNGTHAPQIAPRPVKNTAAGIPPSATCGGRGGGDEGAAHGGDGPAQAHEGVV